MVYGGDVSMTRLEQSMHRLKLHKRPPTLRQRAAHFDEMAQQARDPAMRAQFEALKERFEQQAARASEIPVSSLLLAGVWRSTALPLATPEPMRTA